MLLEKISAAYFYIGTVLFVLFAVLLISNRDFFSFHLVSFLIFILFGIVIYKLTKLPLSFFKKGNLFVLSFFCSVIEVVLFQLLSLYIDGDNLVFSKGDAIAYYFIGLKMSDMNIAQGLEYITSVGYGTDDYGGFMWTSMIFRLLPSLPFLYFANCLIGTISAVMLFNIGRNFMPRRYAFVAALSFSIASFTVVHHSLCLKETIMVFTIIAAFSNFFAYIRTKRILYIILSLFCIILVFFFRVPTALLLLFCFALTLVLLYMKGIIATIIVVLLSLVISSTSYFAFTYERYLRGGNTEAILERKDELAGKGGLVNQLTDPLAAFAGPFPSVNIKSVRTTPLYASGLLYRLLLSVPFFAGAYYIIKKKHIKMYPLLFFFLMNALGVAISVKGLETRLSIPHLSMAYIVAFWFLAKYDYDKLSFVISSKMIYCYFMMILGLCLLWNFR